VFPLWRDAIGNDTNVSVALLTFLSARLGRTVSAEDVIGYIAAVAAHPAFTSRFQDDLATPGLRIPFTADAETFEDAVEIGRSVIWLHTFGERMADSAHGRPSQPPRLPEARRPRIPSGGAIPQDAVTMPDEIHYDPATKRLHIGSGFVENVEATVWKYEVSGKHVLGQWFSYRKKHRERPIIGDRRPPSPLANIQPDHWLAEYTTELINVLNVLGWLVELEPRQAELLERICSGTMITAMEMEAAGVFKTADLPPKKERSDKQNLSLFDA
jgi:hypothetical protein